MPHGETIPVAQRALRVAREQCIHGDVRHLGHLPAKVAVGLHRGDCFIMLELIPIPSLGLLVLVTLLVMAQTTIATQLNTARVLIYSATRDFRHDSIPTAVDALVQGGPAHQIAFDHTEDQTWFTDERLGQYDAVLFLSNTGEGA